MEEETRRVKKSQEDREKKKEERDGEGSEIMKRKG